ncbi:hypothetical protein [Pseudomonas sp. 22 E 5]|jgi:hypothetical protein|nr:hypothetical protein [Pseudomonas sp. 22 E 5]
MNKRLIQALGLVRTHKALRIIETIEAPLAEHVEIIAVRDDLIDV